MVTPYKPHEDNRIEDAHPSPLLTRTCSDVSDRAPLLMGELSKGSNFGPQGGEDLYRPQRKAGLPRGNFCTFILFEQSFYIKVAQSYQIFSKWTLFHSYFSPSALISTHSKKPPTFCAYLFLFVKIFLWNILLSPSGQVQTDLLYSPTTTILGLLRLWNESVTLVKLLIKI